MLRLVAWADDRTGLHTGCKRFFLEQIPASSGWAQTFGSVTLFLFFVQVFTGVLLALNFAPTPRDAYRSLQYITYQIAAGHLVHALHHWGSTFLIVAAMIHMSQVFLYCAYRKPREFTWLVGVLLLLLIFGFGLTGYLLPWDNRAYWGTVVTTRIIASTPFIGPILSGLDGAANGVGAVTYAHFYALHTIVFPAATLVLVLLHLILVRKHGVTPAAEGEGKQSFYPRQMFRDLVSICIAFALLFLTAVILEAPLERLADPTDTSYVPRPEWYFLFLFQLLKIFSGSMEWMATLLLPAGAIVLLVTLPFLPSRFRLSRKLPAASALVFATAIWSTLTVAAFQSSPHRLVSVPPEAVEWAQVAPEEIAGLHYFTSLGCTSCHNLITGFPKSGPNLAASGLHHPKQWLVQHFAHPRDTSHSIVRIPLTELNALSLFVANLSPESVSVMQRMSPQFVHGAEVYVRSACSTCHKINGAGGAIGPPLNGLAERRSREWTTAHFLAPAKLSPGSVMPPYTFAAGDRDAILLYLFSLSN